MVPGNLRVRNAVRQNSIHRRKGFDGYHIRQHHELQGKPTTAILNSCHSFPHAKRQFVFVVRRPANARQGGKHVYVPWFLWAGVNIYSPQGEDHFDQGGMSHPQCLCTASSVQCTPSPPTTLLPLLASSSTAYVLFVLSCLYF